MKKIFAFFIGTCVCMTCVVAMAANFQVKKASSVKTQEKSGLENVTSGSLLPNVIGLVSNVSALTKQQKELQAECVPTSSEISWVNERVKEYAKIGEKSAKDMLGGLKMDKCGYGETYAHSVEVNAAAKLEPCVDVFPTDSNNPHIWDDYPMAATATYCADGLDVCSGSKKKTVSNMYDIFGAINFTLDDYTTDEASTYTKLMEKAEKCAPEKISARTKEAYKNFITSTISGAGTSTNTGGIMQAVGGLTQSGGNVSSGIQSLAPSVLQFLDK